MDGKLKSQKKDSVSTRRNVTLDTIPDVRGTAGKPYVPRGGLVRETADDPVNEDIK